SGWGAAAEAGAKKFLPAAWPLGISFFVFEFVHYLYEVRKGAAPLKNPLQFVLFAIFFPTLVAGPIKRFGQFIPALEEGSRRLVAEDAAAGLRRIAMGFVKKVVIADNLTLVLGYYAPVTPDHSIATFASLTLTTRWFMLALIAFRILMD